MHFVLFVINYKILLIRPAVSPPSTVELSLYLIVVVVILLQADSSLLGMTLETESRICAG